MAEAQWFYSSNGVQAGPVNETELKALAAAGQLKPTDLIWRDGLPDWRPASLMPELFGTESPSPAPIPQPVVQAPYPAPMRSAVLPYVGGGETSGLGSGVTPRTIEVLCQTRPWVLLMSIVMFIVGGLCGFVGMLAIVVGLGSTAGPTRLRVFGVIGVGGGLLYLLIAAFYFAPAVYLNRYATNIARLRVGGRADDLENALEAQKSFWKFAGLVTAIGLSFFVITVLIVIASTL